MSSDSHAHTGFHLQAEREAGLRLARAPSRRAFWLFRVLDASIWVPALMLAFGVAFLIQLHGTGDADVSRALTEVTYASVNDVLLLLVGTLLTAVLLQAVRYAILRIAEGLWPSSGWLTRALISRQHRQLRRLMRKRDYLTERAFHEAAQWMRQAGLPASHIDFLEAHVVRSMPKAPLTKAEQEQALRIDWRHFSSPYVLLGLESVTRRLQEFPQEHRLLPTTLANVLRSAEDDFVSQARPAVTSPADQAPYEEFDVIDQRVDLFCLLCFVFALLGVLSVGVWSSGSNVVAGMVAFALCSLLAFVSYHGAVANARAYRALLGAVVINQR